MTRIKKTLMSVLWVAFIVAACLSMYSCGSNEDDGIASDGDTSDGDGDTDQAVDGDADGDSESDVEKVPVCDSGIYEGQYLIPGPGEDGYDAELDAKARKFDRAFNAFITPGHHLNCSASVPLENEAERALIDGFVNDYDGWDFSEYADGKTADDVVVNGWQKVAGLYGGMGICADAMRYAVLRDQNVGCEEIEIARQILKADLEAMHIAFTIGGVPGVIVRGIMRKDAKGSAPGIETTPLFDGEGNPLPEEKNNGTWREDNSGLYPNYIWEDSCSRDMILGWAAASAVVMEVIREDADFEDEEKEQVRSDAAGVVKMMRVVRESGYDLELLDADGRITYHGYLNEHSTERSLYLDSFKNGFYALMSLGIVGAFVYAADDPELSSYLYDELIDERKLPTIAAEDMIFINMDEVTNWSNYNMAFTSGWLAMRYIDDENARKEIREAIAVQLYDTPDKKYQPVEQKMTLYDWTYILSEIDASVFADPKGDVPETAFENGLSTLVDFHDAPYWRYGVTNCDESETEEPPSPCVLNDGTEVTYLGDVGRKGSDMCDVVIPRKVKPSDNYEWRSNPYRPNGGGDGSGLESGVDFRVAYWLGRFMKIK